MRVKDDYLARALRGEEFLLFDGGFGTMLQARGLSVPGKTADELCVTNPEAIADIHRAYVEAGAQVITTNTFNTSTRALAAQGLPYTVEQIYAAAAQCARDGGAPYVAGDLGPIGEFVEPYGDVEEDEAYELFARNAQAAASAGCDLLVIETMMDLNEALLAVRAAGENCDLPIFATMSFMESGRTLFGVTPEQAAAALVEAGASVVGMNCSVGPEQALPVAQAYAAALGSTPLIVQPNAGLPDMSTGEAMYNCPPEEFVAAVEALVDAGATVLGGCCGTTPDHIAAVAKMLEQKNL